MGKLMVHIDEKRKKIYREQGYWGNATLLDYWNMSVRSFPQKTAVVDYQKKSYTFEQLDQESDKLAVYLQNSGVEVGDIISVQVPNWSEFTLIYIACLKLRAVINPLLPGFRKNELIHRISKCKSKVFFTIRECKGFDHVKLAKEIVKAMPSLQKVIIVDKNPDCEELGFDQLTDIMKASWSAPRYAEAGADDVAAVLFTSGTESLGKGVMLTHNNLCANEKGYLALTQLNSMDSMMMPVPVAHATGFMYGVTVPLMIGMKSVLLDKYEVDKCLELIEREHCTAIEAPTVIAYDVTRRIEDRPDINIQSLRYFYCGGAPIPRTLVEKAIRKNIRILGVYGSTESAPHCVVAPFHPPHKVLSTDGLPVPGVEIRVVDPCGNPVPPWVEGEELSRGPNVFMGYLDEPEFTKAAIDEDGWYHSGDLCVMDDDGYIRITGRKKDVIIRGGENISSVEIEGILLLHENIQEAAVVAYPDDRMGEKACAYLVLKDKNTQLSLKQIQSHMEEHGIAKYKWPERVELVESLPRTETGKIQKFKLREDIKIKLKKEKHVCV